MIRMGFCSSWTIIRDDDMQGEKYGACWIAAGWKYDKANNAFVYKHENADGDEAMLHLPKMYDKNRLKPWDVLHETFCPSMEFWREEGKKRRTT